MGFSSLAIIFNINIGSSESHMQRALLLNKKINLSQVAFNLTQQKIDLLKLQPFNANKLPQPTDLGIIESELRMISDKETEIDMEVERLRGVGVATGPRREEFTKYLSENIKTTFKDTYNA